MEPESPEQELRRYHEAADILWPKGFRSAAGWRFMKDGVTYDLSAADLRQIDRIERERLHVVDESE